MTERMGVDPYSDEWMADHATNVPGILWEAVREISRGYYLDGYAPNEIARLITASFESAMNKYYVLKNGMTVKPFSIEYLNGGWRYVGENVEEGADQLLLVFSEDDIDSIDTDTLKYVRDIDGNRIEDPDAD